MKEEMKEREKEQEGEKEMESKDYSCYRAALVREGSPKLPPLTCYCFSLKSKWAKAKENKTFFIFSFFLNRTLQLN